MKDGLKAVLILSRCFFEHTVNKIEFSKYISAEHTTRVQEPRRDAGGKGGNDAQQGT